MLSRLFFVLSLLNYSKNSSQHLYESEMIKIKIVLKIFHFVIAFMGRSKNAEYLILQAEIVWSK